MDYKEHYRVDAESFDYFDKRYQTQAERRRNESVLHFCTAKAGEKVLDLGSGRGWLAIELAKRGCKVTAVDLTEKNLEYIKKINSTIDCRLGSAYELPFDSERFDWIVMNEVLEHLEEPAKALAHIRGFLEQGGKVMVSVPFREKINYSLCIHCNKLTPHNAHLHSFDLISIRKLFRNNGYNIIKEHLYLNKFLTLVRFNDIFRFLPYFLWHIKDCSANFLWGKASYLSVIAQIK
jgi:ubiquinone/menaquinone biosynthesis C-methylase UbiE